MKPREIKYKDGKLIFEDYAKREVSIREENYLKLMAVEAKYAYRSCLEECLTDPTEVWWEVKAKDGQDLKIYKYIKVYGNGYFVIFALVDEFLNFHLNNFYWFETSESEIIDKLRFGIPVISKLR
ncbi:MAG: PBECR2 nuclease fold domain-containing protein [Algoriphagus sp.]|uniref:PBECR2 nuclease fold domain-containing protein n=1 Tax=Algoriphagus sp. TaxID=1872435 RepID=UPI00329802C7